MNELAGVLHLSPGVPCPHNLTSSRRDWAGVLTQGLPAANLPSRLASLYSLCGESHRLCAQMAVAAAQGRSFEDGAQAAKKLQRETLREHVRRIVLDWPLQLGAKGTATCPSTSGDLQPWLQTRLLGVPVTTWLAEWTQAPATWLRAWSDNTALWLPELLRRARPLSDTVLPAVPFLRVHADPADMVQLACALRHTPGFSRQPLWRGACAETGTWTRLHQPQRHDDQINTPWLRFGARIAEVLRLSLADAPGHSGAQWLAMGSLNTSAPNAPHAGLAWVEMARGLLVHHVQLEGAWADAKVLACHVLAPTEWNFHPQGAVAQALEHLPSAASPANRLRTDVLISAYDPCVKHELTVPKVAHA